MEKIERIGSIIGIIVVCILVFSVFAQVGLATEDDPGRSPNGLDNAGTVLSDPEPGINSGQINDDVAYDKHGLIYGTVVDQDGNTLAGAYIHLDKISLTAATLAPPKYADCASSHVTFSNKEGNYYIKVLPGTYILKAGKGGYGTYISDIFTVGAEGKEVDIILKEAQDIPDQYGKLTGIVYGTTKKFSTAATLVAETAELYKFPLSGASIQAIPEDGNNEYVQSTYTDENGKYELVLKIGVYKVTARVKNNQLTTANTFDAVNSWYTQTITIKISSYVSQLDFLIILSENRYKTILWWVKWS